MLAVGTLQHLHRIHDALRSFVRKRNDKKIAALPLSKAGAGGYAYLSSSLSGNSFSFGDRNEI